MDGGKWGRGGVGKGWRGGKGGLGGCVFVIHLRNPGSRNAMGIVSSNLTSKSRSEAYNVKCGVRYIQ